MQATGLGVTGQAYLAMFSRRPLPNARLLGGATIGLAGLAGLVQAAMVLGGDVYSWETMLLLFCSGVPGAWLAVMGDVPDPRTGLVSQGRRAGLIASFVFGVIVAVAASATLAHGFGIEPWQSLGDVTRRGHAQPDLPRPWSAARASRPAVAGADPRQRRGPQRRSGAPVPWSGALRARDRGVQFPDAPRAPSAAFAPTRHGTGPGNAPSAAWRRGCWTLYDPMRHVIPIRAALCLALVLGCGEPAAAPDAASPGVDATADATDAGADAAPTDPDGGTALVEVSHPREVRGVWIATVFNINWPSRAGLTAAAQRAELDALLDAAADAGLNAVFFQVRAEADAFYRSELEPFSRFLTGTAGGDPGYDPLAYAVEAAHARGLELHAWMNPYRAWASADASGAAGSHLTRARPELTVATGSYHWIDPGLEAGRAHTLAVIRDVLERYDVDGLHFDDYFYPYPGDGGTFDDAATYDAYRAGGGTLSRGDWRRDNVNRMVEAVHALVREVRPDVRFGISPFGIYRPGMPEGIVGLDAYAQIYCDPLAWLDGGWVDYLAPQLYWPTTREAQAFGRLLDWWAARARAADRDLLAGSYLAQLGSSSEWTLDELRTQADLVRDGREDGVRGSVWYHVGPIAENRAGFADVLRRDHYAAPAATPPLPGAEGRPEPPAPMIEGAEVTVAAADALRHVAVYAPGGALTRLVPADGAPLILPRGDHVLSVIDRHGRESLGVPIVIDADAPSPEPPPDGDGCTHRFGGRYGHRACSPSYQCCDGAWVPRSDGGCGACTCVEETGETGCGT
ncbi:MAG TPA: family 10 glycosylhydrolase [Sandaracinaceae bacterium LLY-WYZ-13_1]|nr:family 10 glycosylhydrolase [Sandaracinaceae bacterium LLY-WYZ-13_1]